MLSRSRRHSSERGQVLVLALAFIAFFGLTITALLKFADVTALEHIHAESTARVDASAEGGAALVSSDASRTDIASSWKCDGTDTGTLTMADPTNSKVSYTVPDCNPGNTTSTTSTGANCLLCVLNQTPVPPATTVSGATPVLSATCAAGSCSIAIKTIGGDDYVMGSIVNNTTLTACSTAATCPGSAHIFQTTKSGVTKSCVCNPSVSTYSGALPDPLSTIAAPVGSGQPVGCTGGSWNATKGCTFSLSGKSSATINPGVYNSISVGGQAQVVMSPGVYVLTGSLSVSGQGVVCAPGTISGGVCTPSTSSGGVVLYLTCVGSGASGKAYLPCPAAGATGGQAGFGGNGQIAVSATPCPAGEIVPNCPGYDGVALLADPHLLDPGGVAACEGGSGTCLVEVAGNGASINGSVDTRSGGLSISGNGGDSISGGFLIVNSLFSATSGKTGTGLQLSGPGSIATTSSCTVLDANVYPGTVPPASPARAVVLQQCGSNKSSGIVNFNYSP